MSRGVFAVDVIRPTCAGTLTLLAGTPKDGWFKTLKNSARNCRFRRSVMAVFLKTASSLGQTTDCEPSCRT
jgi:hypothetical protein